MSKDSTTAESQSQRTYKVTEIPAENPDDVRKRDNASLALDDRALRERRLQVNAARRERQS